MTEEEKKAIEYLKAKLCENEGMFVFDVAQEDLRTFLKIVDKQQKEIEQLANGIRVLGTNPDITTEEIIKEFTEKPITEEYMKKFENSYISKDEVLKAIGYEEDDEEYDRLKQDDEKLLAILDTLYSEVCRLEDIEDKKVEVAVAFIEEKRDKYWQNKIRDKIKTLETNINNAEKFDETYIRQCKFASWVLKELLGEQI